MKELNITKLSAPTFCAEDIPMLLDEHGVAFQDIDTVNWPQFPYQPEVKFRIAYTDDSILLHYKVKEDSIRAVAPHDNGRVWEDSCVEFFCIPAADGCYYNFECNCAGTLLIEAGKQRSKRVLAPQHVLDKVLRWSSIGAGTFEERIGSCEWEMALLIPFTAFFRHQVQSLAGKAIRANFYKCGDALQKPHYLSWNPIDLPQPNFHCPAFFGLLNFN